MNDNFLIACSSLDYPYKSESQYGLLQLDKDYFIEEALKAGEAAEKGYAKYEEALGSINSLLNENSSYTKASNKFYSIYIATSVSCMSVSLIVFQLIIPLLMKKGQTLTMKLFKLAPVTKQDGTTPSKSLLTLRFFVIYLMEYLSVFLLINIIGLIFVALITFVLICFSPKRSTLHDLITRTELVNEKDVYSSCNIELIDHQ